jgi:hypothetical protein
LRRPPYDLHHRSQRQKQHKGSTAPPTPIRGFRLLITTRSHPHTAPAETRHATLTWVERNFGFAVAEAYAGHEDNRRGARAMGAMATYVRAGLPEVATALAALTGEPHPLAISSPGDEYPPGSET